VDVSRENGNLYLHRWKRLQWCWLLANIQKYWPQPACQDVRGTSRLYTVKQRFQGLVHNSWLDKKQYQTHRQKVGIIDHEITNINGQTVSEEMTFFNMSKLKFHFHCKDHMVATVNCIISWNDTDQTNQKYRRGEKLLQSICPKHPIFPCNHAVIAF